MIDKTKAATATSAAAKKAGASASGTEQMQGEGVADLPYARGKTFATLDEYLAHLEQNGMVDLPWWREISPGVYEWVTTKTGAESKTATRAELMQQYGFDR